MGELATLALVATIAGSIITVYSAYKIHAIRGGQGRKLRDMEVLRRLNISPKKQVRVWSFLLALGLVLLTPGLGYLLCCDQISGSGGDAPYSYLRANPSGDPTAVPLSEKLDKTPRTVEKGGFGSSGLTFFPSGGGSSRRSSSGGGSTKTASSSSENVTGIDERAMDNDTLSSGGDDPGRKAPEADDAAEISETESGSSDPEIDAPSEMKGPVPRFESGDGETEPAMAESRAETVRVEAAPEKTSAEIASEIPDPVGRAEPALASSEVTDAGPLVPATPGYSREESAAVDVAPEKRSVPATTEPLMAETVPMSDPAERARAPPADESGAKRGEDPDAEGSSLMGDGLDTPSPEPSDSEAGPDLQEESTVSEGEEGTDPSLLLSVIGDPGAEDPMAEGASDPPEVPGTGPEIGEVKRLVFKEEPESEANRTGLAETGLDLPFGDSGMQPGLDAPGEGFDLDTEFKDFRSGSRSATGIDVNGTLKTVPIREFEKIDLSSNFRRGSGLTPSSPFG